MSRWRAIALAGLLGLAACSGTGGQAPVLDDIHDALKLAEGKAYDAAADIMTAYCKQLAEATPALRAILWQEKRELRREVCQRGDYGPDLPADNPGNCAGGPVVLVICRGVDLPPDIQAWVLAMLARRWQDGEP